MYKKQIFEIPTPVFFFQENKIPSSYYITSTSAILEKQKKKKRPRDN
jgi:hypothetical protein